MIDVFLAQELDAGRIAGNLEVTAPEIQIHGHCHQKALYGTKSMRAFLEQLTNAKVEEIPSGCCGMAGSFGYEKEHYDLSKKIGEQILFPAVRQMKDDSALVACGVSCRQQIEHFTEKKAVHWVEVVKVKK
jgi:Fe-S oxidoreductase